MAFTKLTKDMNIIQKLEDEPNDVGDLTAAELKAKFDEPGNAVKDWINNTFLPEAEGALRDARLESLPAHGHLHTADGADPITPGMIGARKTSGGKHSAHVDANTFLTEGSYIAGAGATSTAETNAAINLPAEAGYFSVNVYATLNNMDNGCIQVAYNRDSCNVYIRKKMNGTWSAWKKLATTAAALLKTEKPSGSYTGNGDATARTIDTKGVGNLIMIWTANTITFVCPTGAVLFNLSTQVVTFMQEDQAVFADGVLTLALPTIPNTAGGNYPYQVL